MDNRPDPSTVPDTDREHRTGWARIPGATGTGSQRVLLIALVVGACMIIAGVSVALFSSPRSSPGGAQAGPAIEAGGSPAAGAPAAPSAAATRLAGGKAGGASGRATPSPAVASDPVAKSVLGWQPGRKHQILRWEAGSGGKNLATVQQQMGTAMQDAGVKLYAGMRVACTQVISAVGTAQAGPPIPDGPMQRLYTGALTGLSRAAADCQAAITMHGDGEDISARVDGAALDRSRVEFAAMSRKLFRATGQITSYHH